MSWFSSLFRKKPAAPKPFTLTWSGVNVAPDGGSMTLAAGDNGTAVTEWGAVGVQPVKVACKGGVLNVTCSTAPTVGLTVLVYKYADAGVTWIGGWCPSIDVANGHTAATLDLSAYTFAANEYVRVWIGYPLVNTGTITVKASISFTPIG